ncbi:MAG: hypothetical protein J6B86_01745 [Clostridia bacterium]|nr:hypothetical protein [Clostridia bacterium]
MNNEIFDTAVTTGKKVLRKAGETALDLAEIARIKWKIAELKSALARKYRRLGLLACDVMDGGDLTMSEEMQKIYNEINDLKQSIASLKEEL